MITLKTFFTPRNIPLSSPPARLPSPNAKLNDGRSSLHNVCVCPLSTTEFKGSVHLGTWKHNNEKNDVMETDLLPDLVEEDADHGQCVWTKQFKRMDR